MIWWLLTPVAKLLPRQLMPAFVPTGAPQSSVRDVHVCFVRSAPWIRKPWGDKRTQLLGCLLGLGGGSSHPFPPQPKSVLFSILNSHNVNLSLFVAYVSFFLPRQCLFMWALEHQAMSFWGFPMHDRVQSSFLGFWGEVAPSLFRQRPRHLPPAPAVPHRLPLTSASDRHVLSTEHSFGDFHIVIVFWTPDRVILDKIRTQNRKLRACGNSS